MSTQTNGQIRKSLSQEIDRLDQLLDGLGDGINEVVAAAVKEAVTVAVKETVQGLVAELVSHPELATLARTVVAPPPAKQRGGVGAWLRSAGRACRDRVRQAGRAAAWLWRQLADRVRAAVRAAAAVVVAGTARLAASGLASLPGRVWGWLKGLAAWAWDGLRGLVLPAAALGGT